MLALTAMSATVTAIFFAIALVLFILGALNVPARINLIAAGLAVWVFVLFWDALARA